MGGTVTEKTASTRADWALAARSPRSIHPAPPDFFCTPAPFWREQPSEILIPPITSAPDPISRPTSLTVHTPPRVSAVLLRPLCSLVRVVPVLYCTVQVLQYCSAVSPFAPSQHLLAREIRLRLRRSPCTVLGSTAFSVRGISPETRCNTVYFLPLSAETIRSVYVRSHRTMQPPATCTCLTPPTDPPYCPRNALAKPSFLHQQLALEYRTLLEYILYPLRLARNTVPVQPSAPSATSRRSKSGRTVLLLDSRPADIRWPRSAYFHSPRSRPACNSACRASIPPVFSSTCFCY